MFTKMAMKTIFFRAPNISKHQLLPLVIAIVLFVGYLLLERKTFGVERYVEAKVSSNVKIVGERKSRHSGPSLTFGEKEFLLQGKPLRILSGAIHYFRVVPEYWKDRLLKLKAMGLNTVET